MTATVLGAGTFGTTLAKVLAENGHQVKLWSHSPEPVASILNQRENSLYLPGIHLPENIIPTPDLVFALSDSNIIVSVVPTQKTREVWQKAAAFLPAESVIVAASKGIEQKTHKLVPDIFTDILGTENRQRLLVLSGPSFARELAQKMPTAITIAGTDSQKIQSTQNAFGNDYLRVYGSHDVTGVELGGALKNVMALATGISDGLGMGHNTRAAIITRGLAEIARLGVKMGADITTFMGLSGLGDLVLTCTGDLSRNRHVGYELGLGRPLAEIQAGSRTIAEGVPTTESAYELAQLLQVEMPITEAVYRILYQNVPASLAMAGLMSRAYKFEKSQ